MNESIIMHIFRPIRLGIFCCCLFLLGSMLMACGVEGLLLVPPNLVAGLPLADLEAIQDDERLTVDQQRERIREATGAPVTEAGDRLVEFLLNFNVR